MFGKLVSRIAPLAVLLGVASKTPRGDALSTGSRSHAPASKDDQIAVFSGGCFWGIQAVFQHVKGVTNAISGYAGGDASSARYDRVSEGNTGHAESVQVTFDPSQVSYEQLLQVFFTVAHDPTQLNRQGPDMGSQYRSAIFYKGDAQKKAALASKEAIEASKRFKEPIVTQIVEATEFYPAEEYHQDFYKKNPLRYKLYRTGCGRDKRLEELWGKDAGSHIATHAAEPEPARN